MYTCMIQLHAFLSTINRQNHDQNHNEVFSSTEKCCSYTNNLCILRYLRKQNWPYRMKYSKELQISYRVATYDPLCSINLSQIIERSPKSIVVYFL